MAIAESETAELVDRCRQGDDLAWERLVRTFQGRVYALAYHYVRDADAARDLAQEIFVRVYQKIDTFSGQAFLPWLLRLARNLCIDRLRRIKARPPAHDVPVEDDGHTLAGARSTAGPRGMWAITSVSGNESSWNRSLGG